MGQDRHGDHGGADDHEDCSAGAADARTEAEGGNPEQDGDDRRGDDVVEAEDVRHDESAGATGNGKCVAVKHDGVFLAEGRDHRDGAVVDQAAGKHRYRCVTRCLTAINNGASGAMETVVKELRIC